ncbi:phage major tail tube protein [Vibrio sp. JC009]|uniref:phage major tail tube protein n=1 Tax=Vibrio sp. JC009 TaxID=2912314 RepID=UPI0023AEB9A7|nr:phage major tail tube protein [Vibrio sp. JC009]WED23083.1 phage major tail tube protein [Vibrio sp. JC009]
MANRVRRRLWALMEGMPIMNEIMEITPPEITFKTVASEGSFVETEHAVGVNKLSWSIKVRGEHAKLAAVFGKFMMKKGQFNFYEKGASTDGIPYYKEHSCFSTITSMKEDPMKMGEMPSCTIEGVCTGYKLTDSGITIHDINVDTGQCVVFGANLMQEVNIT